MRFVDLNHDEPVKVLEPRPAHRARLPVPVAHRRCTPTCSISLPKLKTHHWAGATLSLKNLFGTLPGICYGWPKNELHWRGIPNSIVDIALHAHARTSRSWTASSAWRATARCTGTAKHVGALVMGVDPVAVDATCCRLMGLPPERLPTLVFAAAKRLGRLTEAEIPQLGEPIAALATAFELPPQIEKQLLPEPQPS